jgi:RNase P subunit RPR2
MTVEVVGFDEKAKKQATCKNCGSILQYLPKDVRKQRLRHFDETTVHHVIDCPECGQTVRVKG